MLKEVRAEVADLLMAGGLEAHHYVPERVAPPVVVVQQGEPYLEKAETFNQLTIRLQVMAIAGKATNEKSTDELDDLVESVLAALPEWDLEGVSQPFTLQTSNAEYLAASVTITAWVSL